MATPILTTKLYIQPPPPKAIQRHRLLTRLNEGLHGKLTLISAAAGFGKTTLVSEWVGDLQMVNGEQPVNQVAWLSLDEEDNDPARFLTYLIAALQTVLPTIGDGVMRMLQAPPLSVESVLTALINEITTTSTSSAQVDSTPIILILDDYHQIDNQAIDHLLIFLLDHLPPQMHLVIATREDPSLPLARLRVRGQLTELRAADLRFTPDEAATFFNQTMALNLSAENIAALETRTEGWIAGLQLAALALQGQPSLPNQQETTSFIQSFTGSHRFVLDYLVEEVLHQQSERIQTFLLHTSILDRLCASLCEAVLDNNDISGQETLTYLERANLFLIPLDNERRWYRYHHLFADLLQQRLQHSASDGSIAKLHSRASIWYEENDLEIEAFQHAVAANDIARAERLMEGRGMPLLFRGAVAPVTNWLASLPTAVMDANPSLWVTYASTYLFNSKISGIEEKLQAAEAALQGSELNDQTRDLIGRIASMRATVAVSQHQVETILTQSRIALDYLHPDNLPVRTSVIWNIGYANELQGNREIAKQAYIEANRVSEAIGHFIIHLMSTLGIGGIQEAENQLRLAAKTYQDVLKLAGDPPMAVACAAQLGLARLYYEWNDLDAAQEHGQQSLLLARQFHGNVDREVASELFLARLKLAQGDLENASILLAKANQTANQQNFIYRLSEITAVQVQIFLQQGNLTAAVQLAQTHDLPLSQARVHLAQGNAADALAILASYRQQMEAKGWADALLKVMVLQAIAYEKDGDTETAVSHLSTALTLAEPGGFIRTFIDEGAPMAKLLESMKNEGEKINIYIQTLLTAFGEDRFDPSPRIPQPLEDPLSERELEVLQLVAQGYSNREISEQLFLALDTVKGHNRRIFGKLQVQNRTEAARKARELGIL